MNVPFYCSFGSSPWFDTLQFSSQENIKTPKGLPLDVLNPRILSVIFQPFPAKLVGNAKNYELHFVNQRLS